MEYFHAFLRELKIYFDKTGGDCGKTSWDGFDLLIRFISFTSCLNEERILMIFKMIKVVLVWQKWETWIQKIYLYFSDKYYIPFFYVLFVLVIYWTKCETAGGTCMHLPDG